MCSILSQRVMEQVNSLKVLHKIQIGYGPDKPTADQVFTLRGIVSEELSSQLIFFQIKQLERKSLKNMNYFIYTSLRGIVRQIMSFVTKKKYTPVLSILGERAFDSVWHATNNCWRIYL